MIMRQAILSMVAVLSCAIVTDAAFAQSLGGYAGPQTTAQKSYQSPIAQKSQSAPQVSASNPNNANRSRPFDNMARKPTVSPYLNLLNGGDANVTNYQSLVRPMVNQNRVNAQARSAIANLQHPSSGPQGSENMRATGHQAVFQNYSHYYPGKK